MAKKFYVAIDVGYDGVIKAEFNTSEEVQAFLLEYRQSVDSNPDDVWVIFGERFGFESDKVSTAFRLKGPE